MASTCGKKARKQQGGTRHDIKKSGRKSKRARGKKYRNTIMK